MWKIAVESDNLDVTRGGPQAVVLFDNLPGYPDNLMRGLDGKIWLGFAKPRNPSADAVADKPFLRKLALRLPRALWPVPATYGHVLAFTEDGNVVADLQDPTGAYPDTTGVTETPDRLYVQSLHATRAWLATPLRMPCSRPAGTGTVGERNHARYFVEEKYPEFRLLGKKRSCNMSCHQRCRTAVAIALLLQFLAGQHEGRSMNARNWLIVGDMPRFGSACALASP